MRGTVLLPFTMVKRAGPGDSTHCHGCLIHIHGIAEKIEMAFGTRFTSTLASRSCCLDESDIPLGGSGCPAENSSANPVSGSRSLLLGFEGREQVSATLLFPWKFFLPLPGGRC